VWQEAKSLPSRCRQQIVTIGRHLEQLRHLDDSQIRMLYAEASFHSAQR
jgi:hypothetical protein